MTHEPFSFPSYIEATNETAIYPGGGVVSLSTGEGGTIEGLGYVTLGLVGEAGELANDMKKILRDDGGVLTLDRRERMSKELGDVFWYWVRSCMELGINPELVIGMNLEKLRMRKAMGTLQGSGNDR